MHIKKTTIFAFLLVFTLMSLIIGCGGGAEQPAASSGASEGGQAAAPQETAAPEPEAIDFPTKDVTFIVPVSPGGGMDATARLLVKYWEEHLGGKMIVENITGAEYNNAIFAMLKAEADGHQVIMLPGVIINQLLDDSIPYDLNEFGWIGRVSSNRLITVASNKSGLKTIEDIQKLGDTVAGVTGISSSQTVAQLLMAKEIGINVSPVTHKGTAESVLSTVRGDTDWTVATEVTLVNHIQNGEVVPLFIGGGEERFPDLPDTPTLNELGYPEADSLMGFHRIVATNPETPEPVLKALRDSFEKAVNDPRFAEDLKKLNDKPDYLNGEDTAALVKANIDLIAPEMEYIKSFKK